MYPTPPPPPPYGYQRSGQYSYSQPSYQQSGHYGATNYDGNQDQSRPYSPDRKFHKSHDSSSNPHGQANFFPPKFGESQNPSKRQKGNPVITRYPMPGGYAGAPNASASPNYGHGQVPVPPPFYPPQAPYPQYQQPQAIPPPPPGFPIPPPPPPNYRGYQQAQSYAQTPFHPPPPSPYGVIPPPPIPTPQWQHPSQQPWVPPPPPITRVSSYKSHASPTPASSHTTWHDSGQVAPNSLSTSKHQSPVPKDSSPVNSTPRPASSPRSNDEANQPAESAIDHNYAGWPQDEYEYDPDGSEDGDPPDMTNNELSLGIVVWKPGVSVRRVIPSRFADVDGQTRNLSVANRPDESVSKYATHDNKEESCLPVRNTDHWSNCKDDPIFMYMPSDDEVIPFEELMRNRSRPAPVVDRLGIDEEMEEGEVTSPARREGINQSNWNESRNLDQAAPSRRLSSEDQPNSPISVDPNSNIKADEDETYSPPPPADSSGTDVERTPSPSIVVPRPVYDETLQPTEVPGDDEEYTSISIDFEAPQNKVDLQAQLEPYVSENTTTTTDLPDGESQDDVLARLGVTGSPKPVYTVPSPGRMSPPEATSRERSRSPRRTPPSGLPPKPQINYRERDPIPVGSFEPPPPPPPPPPPVATTKSDSWSAFGQDGAVSPKSETSQHTLAGSDFHADDTNGTKPVKPEEFTELNGNESPESPVRQEGVASRKRNRDDAINEDDGVKRQADDTTPARRRRQPRVAAAYNRRW